MIKIIDSRTNPYIKYVEKLKNTSFSSSINSSSKILKELSVFLEKI